MPVPVEDLHGGKAKPSLEYLSNSCKINYRKKKGGELSEVEQGCTSPTVQCIATAEKCVSEHDLCCNVRKAADTIFCTQNNPYNLML